MRGFPGGLGVKNPPCNAGNSGLIPGWGAKIPHVHEPELESPQRSNTAQLRPDAAKENK